MNSLSLQKIALSFFIVLGSQMAHSSESTYGIGVASGSGSDGTLKSLNITTHEGFWSRELGTGWSLIAELESSLTRIQGKGSNNREVWVVGISPVLTLQSKESPTFLELGVGLSYFDTKQITDSLSVGTHLEFADLVGFGFKFGRKGQYDLGFRWIHYSNAGISTNNPGLDFQAIRFRAKF